MPRRCLHLALAAVLTTAVGCTHAPMSETEEPEPAAEIAVAADVEERLARFVPTEIRADLSPLSAEDREVLALKVTPAPRPTLNPQQCKDLRHGYPAGAYLFQAKTVTRQ